MKLISRLVSPLLLGLVLFSGVSSAEMHEGQSIEGMQVHSVWVCAVPPSSRMSAADMVLRNNTADDDHLVSTESDVAQSV